MSTAEVRSDQATGDAGTGQVALRFEAVVIPVSDVDRAKASYGNLGWRLDADFAFDNGFRVVQFTPPGSACHASYGSFGTFSDPDGNGWLLQEITTRLPGRIDTAETTFASVNDLANAMRRAAAAHGEHETRTGQHDENWPDWYGAYMVAEQAGAALPS